jgi:anti-sigma regulatory factor (Ser/Thr protein kinase)
VPRCIAGPFAKPGRRFAIRQAIAANAVSDVQAAIKQARKGLKVMVSTAIEVDPRLIAFVLPSIPESVRIARLHVRTALGFHGLAEYAEDAAIITSELVTNAVQHVRVDGAETIGVTLAHAWSPPTVMVVVSDSSPSGPVLRDALLGRERGRGLRIVEALSAHWGWLPEVGGKAIYAVLARQSPSAIADISSQSMPHDIDADNYSDHTPRTRDACGEPVRRPGRIPYVLPRHRAAGT